MKYVLISLSALFLFSCQSLPQLFQTADDILDDAITVSVDKDAINQNTDVNVQVQIKNKDSKE